MVHRKRIQTKILGFLLTVVASLPALGQSDRGAISGTVTDQNGGAIKQAKVTVVNMDSGASREVITTEDGAFVVPELKAAPYKLTVEAAGFKTTTLDRLQIAVQVTRRVDVKLEIGAVGEVTTVTASAGALQTESPVLQTNITERQVRELPLQIGAESGGRSPLSFIFLDSSVASGGGLGDQATAASRGTVGFNFRVNGGQGLGTEILIDGAATRRAENGTFFSEVAPGPNAFQEFTISTAQYSAEYGNSSGGVVNFTIKSGSNAFHGELYENLRNEALNANLDFNRLAGLPRPLDRQHDFGGSIGGPIYLPRFGEGGPAVKGFRNRAFFFFNYGGYRLSQFETVDVSVPTLKMRSGDFSELLTDPYITSFFGGPVQIFDNTVPCCNRPTIPGNRLDLYRNAAGNSIIDPVGFKIINSLFPAPNRDGVYHNFRTTTGAPATTNYYVQKLDFNLSDKHRLSFSSTFRKLNSVKGGFPRFPEPWVAQGIWRQEFRSQYYRLQEDYTIRPNLLNHFNAGFSRSFVQNRNFTRGMNPSTTLGLPANATQNLGLPLIGFPLRGDPVTSRDPRAYQPGGSTFFDNQDGDNAVQFTDFVAWSRGRHTLKFGAEARWQQLNDSNHFDIGGNFNFLENQTANGDFSGRQGWPVASLITGAPEFSFATIQSIDPGFRFFSPTFFVQDDVKVTSKLTVNVGVRYDIPYPRVEARDRYRGFNSTAINPVVGRPGAIIGVAGEGGAKSKYRGLIKPDYTDVSPRFGFAYRINEKTVVRGGYGLYYAPLLYNEFGRGGLAGYAIQGGANINFGFDANIRFNNYPALPVVDPTIQLIGADVEGFNENFKNGRTAQYSLDIQRELPGRMALSLSYVGSKGTRLRSNFSPPNALPFNALKLGGPLLRTPLGDVTAAQRAYAQSVGVPLPANNAAVFAGFNGTVAQALRPFPHYGRITEHMESEGQSAYNALKVDLQRRFGQGLQMGVSYTFSKLLTDAAEDLFGTTPTSGVIQNPYDRESLWSPSTNVVPHSFVANYLYELPFGKNKAFLNRGKALDAIFGGWQFTGVLRYRQGAGLVPFVAGRSRDFLDLIGFTGNLRPNITGQSFYTNNRPGGVQYAYLNPAAFSRPPDFEPLNAGNPLFGAADVGSAAYAAYYANPLRFFGNAAPSYGNLRGLPFFSEDFSIAKKTRLTERITIELRADVFNAFNRGRFLLPDMNFDNAFTFGISGRAPNSFQPRGIQIVGRLIF
ncbi:MAG TPA: TonB-dependent receptor [Blastocatellia bacterium]|nr:TonB-dependent receptor [Blastocatellia bacterium]